MRAYLGALFILLSLIFVPYPILNAKTPPEPDVGASLDSSASQTGRETALLDGSTHGGGDLDSSGHGVGTQAFDGKGSLSINPSQSSGVLKDLRTTKEDPVIMSASSHVEPVKDKFKASEAVARAKISENGKETDSVWKVIASSITTPLKALRSVMRSIKKKIWTGKGAREKEMNEKVWMSNMQNEQPVFQTRSSDSWVAKTWRKLRNKWNSFFGKIDPKHGAGADVFPEAIEDGPKFVPYDIPSTSEHSGPSKSHSHDSGSKASSSSGLGSSPKHSFGASGEPPLVKPLVDEPNLGGPHPGNENKQDEDLEAYLGPDLAAYSQGSLRGPRQGDSMSEPNLRDSLNGVPYPGLGESVNGVPGHEEVKQTLDPTHASPSKIDPKEEIGLKEPPSQDSSDPPVNSVESNPGLAKSASEVPAGGGGSNANDKLQPTVNSAHDSPAVNFSKLKFRKDGTPFPLGSLEDRES